MIYIPVLIAVLSLLCPGPNPMYTLEKLSGQINTKYDEINPVVSLDGKTIYFTRVGHPSFDKTLKVDQEDYSKTLGFNSYIERLKDVYAQLGDGNNTDPISSAFNQDIWIATSEHGNFDQIIHPSYPLNSALPNSVCAVTTDPNMIIIVNQFYKDGGMQKGFSFAKMSDWHSWRFPEPLFIYDYYNLEAGVNLTLSKDNEVMVLSMQRHNSLGENDLYVSFRVHTTLWSAPLHMGDVINSIDNEITPFLSDDKRFIFFSSKSQAGTDQDVYVSERLDDSWTEWSTPRALPTPINSGSDEAQPFLNQKSGYLYFTSTRDGSSDIFRVNFEKPESQPVAIPIVKTAEAPQVKCLIVDGKTGNPIIGSLQYGYAGEDGFHDTKAVDTRGIQLPIDDPQKIVRFKAKAKGYITREIRIDVAALLLKEKNPVILVPADPLVPDAKISLAPIYFLRGKDKILSGSFAELDRLFSIMKQHPSLQIKIEGHTDNVGDEFALFMLSDKRASAIKKYLVTSGIQAYRIKTKAFGPRKPLNDNSSEELRSMNRRVDVIITKV
ncbi:MAG: OmpA family protein [Saprospiraceae bacterium]|nr:OmpA family protein [Saprospiraceae bacterium]